MSKKPVATEEQVLNAVTAAVNGLAATHIVTHVTLIGVFTAIRLEQEALFTDAQRAYRMQQAARSAIVSAEDELV